jgi:hypothetical protein
LPESRHEGHIAQFPDALVADNIVGAFNDLGGNTGLP